MNSHESHETRNEFFVQQRFIREFRVFVSFLVCLLGPVAAIAHWYLVQELSAVEAAAELGLDDGAKLKAAV